MGVIMEYLLFTDETNLQPAQDSKFFIYGGVFFPTNILGEIHNLVESARIYNNFVPEDEFKFDTRSRPAHVEINQHRAAKNAVLNGCMNLGVKFVACLVLHSIASRHTLETLISWGANSVFCAFDRFLQEENTNGIAIADRLPFRGNFRFLQEKFQMGLTFPWGTNRRLENIHLYGFSCIGTSHASSAIDIILGAFRYCVNERDRHQKARNMLPNIVRMMWHKRDNSDVQIKDYGLLYRPKKVRVDEYRRQYNELTNHFVRILRGD